MIRWNACAFYRSRHGRWSNPSNPGNPPRRESRRLREATSAVVSLIRGQVWGARHQKGWTKNSTRSRGRRCEELEEQRNTTHTNTHRHTTHHTPHTARRARHTIDQKSRVNEESEQVFECSSVQVFKCSSVQVFKCSNVQVFKCSSVQGPKEEEQGERATRRERHAIDVCQQRLRWLHLREAEQSHR